MNDHAYLEGEGNRSLEYWRKVHKDFFVNCKNKLAT
ncbi:ASCH domain-containing protein [Lactiplantibacillus plantarum]